MSGSYTFHQVDHVLTISSLSFLLIMILLNEGTCLILAQQNAWFIAKDITETRALAIQGSDIQESHIAALFSAWEGKSQLAVVGAEILSEGTGRRLSKVST